MDENEIEIKVEKMIDRLDFQYLKGVIDASEYDEKMKEIKDWSEQQYKNL
jgi:tellurite resistance protein